ncbi:uncharacterized protein V1518DRAFT_416110 [Limtongia smithiae]|uniref:uncharacterized protein n=1 Tax=Limtongia smithiae TaxID=1125753 RepID=UPI0034CE2315
MPPTKMLLAHTVLALLSLAALVAAEAKTPGIFALRPWTRTAPNGGVETVTPMLVEGVTLSPRPPVVTATAPVPWISLKNNGAPVTVKPKVKKYGFVERPSPTYGTWFAEETGAIATANEWVAKKVAAKEAEKAAAAGKPAPAAPKVVMGGKYYAGEFERLNPVLRCTPERYLLNGELAPFCSPDHDTDLLSGHAYFITWYPRYFNATKVRINLLDYDTLAISSPDGDVQSGSNPLIKEFAFYTTDWIENELGYFYLEVNPKWIGKVFSKSVYIQIESTSEAAEDLNVQHVPLVKLLQGPRVRNADKARYENQTWEMALAIPLSVLVFAVGLVIFHFCTRRARRIGNIYVGGHRNDRSRRRNRKSGYEKLEEGPSSASLAEIKSVG